MPPNDNRIDARDWSLLALLSVLWGGSFFFNGAALRELPPLTLVFLRVGLGAAILLPLLRVQGIRFPKGMAGWKPFVAIGSDRLSSRAAWRRS
ncbi:drug/metabolite transporter (DMT)-like permease [Bradyrhizobium sp. LB12.1]